MLVCLQKRSVDKDKKERMEKHNIRNKEQGEVFRNTYHGTRSYKRHLEAGNAKKIEMYKLKLGRDLCYK